MKMKSYGQQGAFANQGPAMWKELSIEITHKDIVDLCNIALKTHLFSTAGTNLET